MEACLKCYGTLSSLRVIQPDKHSFQVYHLIMGWYIANVRELSDLLKYYRSAVAPQ